MSVADTPVTQPAKVRDHTDLTAFLRSRSATNVVWNLVGGFWAGVLTVVSTPLYVSRLGLEGYGIVGLWLTMQVMMGLLDAGMSATVVKAFAGSSSDKEGHEYKRDLLRTLELCYWGMAFAMAAFLILAADWLGAHWLKSGTLSPAQISASIRLIAIALCLQFPSSLYTNGLAGLQEHRRMNELQILGNSLRYGGGVLVVLWRPDVAWFFVAQSCVAAIQTFTTRHFLWKMLAGLVQDPTPSRVRFVLIQRLWRYSTGMALTSIAAVLMANADRVALSKLLPTTELGKYSIAFTATGLLQLGIQPFYRAFFPRYAELVAAGDTDRLRAEYFRSCQLVAALVIPLGIVGWVFAPQLFFTWLGRQEPTVVAVFRWLLVGITCSGVMWLPAAFQQANGWTRLHASMIAGALVVGGPIMVFMIKSYGVVGATTIWVLHGLSLVTIELWIMHKRLLKGELWSWYRSVVVPSVLRTAPVVALGWWLMPSDLGRWTGFSWIVATGVAVAIVQVLGVLRSRDLGRRSAGDIHQG